MQTAEEQMKQEGAAVMSLEVAENNAAARHFYRSLGFVTRGRIAKYYGGRVDAEVMEKVISSRASLVEKSFQHSGDADPTLPERRRQKSCRAHIPVCLRNLLRLIIKLGDIQGNDRLAHDVQFRPHRLLR